MRTLLVLGLLVVVTGCANVSTIDNKTLANQVMEAEKSFARTLAHRDLRAFREFIADEAVFFSNQAATRGRDKIVQEWTGYFNDSVAPFSWTPDRVEVLDSGTLALSTGPVSDVNGKVIARFNSIWRREASGKWKVVFDKGCEVCTVCQR